MMATTVCSGCGAVLDPTLERCAYCGQVNPSATEAAQERWLSAWTQGISQEGYSNGNYDLIEYPAMPLSQAMQILRRLPVPPRVKDPGNYCPPAIGFDERNISRREDGSYYLWPEDRACSLQEAEMVVRQIYGYSSGPHL